MSMILEDLSYGRDNSYPFHETKLDICRETNLQIKNSFVSPLSSYSSTVKILSSIPLTRIDLCWRRSDCYGMKD